MAFTVLLNRADLVDDLVTSLRRSGCDAHRTGSRACQVVHADALDEDEARTELAFFLRVWQAGHPCTQASLVA